jgi:hypothetical protein
MKKTLIMTKKKKPTLILKKKSPAKMKSTKKYA